MDMRPPIFQPNPRSSASGAAPAVQSTEYLSFRLGAEEYGVDILCVQEIRSYEVPTRIAHAPAFVKGVINLRGVIVPIVDLRLQLGCERAEYGPFTVVIVVRVHGRVVGAVVDSVSDVVVLTADRIQPAPEMNTAVDTGFVRGIATANERMLVLLDIEALMSSRAMGLMDDTRDGPQTQVDSTPQPTNGHSG